MVHKWCMYGACMVHVWCMYGACTVHVWCMCGACMVHVWCMYGACMVHVWCMYRACMVHVWCMYGACMVHVWCMYGACTVHVCDGTHGAQTEQVWNKSTVCSMGPQLGSRNHSISCIFIEWSLNPRMLLMLVYSYTMFYYN